MQPLPDTNPFTNTDAEKDYGQLKTNRGEKEYCMAIFHMSNDSNQSEMYSYATKVTAPAGADFTTDGKSPL